MESASRAHTPMGENFITMSVILYITSARSEMLPAIRLPLSPSRMSAVPKKMENTMICGRLVLTKELKIDDAGLLLEDQADHNTKGKADEGLCGKAEFLLFGRFAHNFLLFLSLFNFYFACSLATASPSRLQPSTMFS